MPRQFLTVEEELVPRNVPTFVVTTSGSLPDLCALQAALKRAKNEISMACETSDELGSSHVDISYING